jgi:hypothetical protein
MKRFVDEWGLRQFEAEGDQAAALAKLEAVAGRFALLHHVVGRATSLKDTEPIGLNSIEAGIQFARWCANELDRVYRVLKESPEEKDTRKLLDLVNRLSGRHGGRVTVKLLQRSNSRKYLSRDAAAADLERLAGCGLGYWENGPIPLKGGKRAQYFVISPDHGNDDSRPSTTHDDSDDRPDKVDDDPPAGSGGALDDRPDPPDERPVAGSKDANATDNGEGSSDESAERWECRSSESSCVVQDSAAEIVPVENEARSARIVMQTESQLVADSEGLGRVVAAVIGAGGPVGLDIETTGLNPVVDQVRLLSLATPRATFLIDLFQVGPPELENLFAALTGIEIVGHNLGFDLPFLMRLGFTPGAGSGHDVGKPGASRRRSRRPPQPQGPGPPDIGRHA